MQKRILQWRIMGNYTEAEPHKSQPTFKITNCFEVLPSNETLFFFFSFLWHGSQWRVLSYSRSCLSLESFCYSMNTDVRILSHLLCYTIMLVCVLTLGTWKSVLHTITNNNKFDENNNGDWTTSFLSIFSSNIIIFEKLANLERYWLGN